MIRITTFAGRKVALFGLGGSGLASASALLAGGAGVTAGDDSEERMTQARSAGIPTADLRTIDWSKIAALVLAPGIPLTHPQPHWVVQLAQAAGVEIIGDIELFCRERRKLASEAPFIAITGTNGKSTTTALTAHILAHAKFDVQMGGNIGTAILSLQPPHAGRAYVIECSSYQIDLAPTIDPSVGILINLSEDHLDRHGTLDHYGKVKERLVAGVPAGGTAIIGVDDPFCAAAADRAALAGKRVTRISAQRALDTGVYVDGEQIMLAENGKVHAVALLGGIGSLRGRHNAQNAACAVATALALGLDPRTIQEALWSFPGLAHRMEEIGRIGDVLFVNDSKATNADSAAQALACFENIYWIAGGKAKTGGITSLEKFFPRIRKTFLIGEASDEFAATLDGRIAYDKVQTLDRAVAAAAQEAAVSDLNDAVVLLSPACASFDQYRNFEVRGDAFRALVKALPGLVPVNQK